MARLIIPTPLRKFTENNSEFKVEAKSVKEAFDKLVENYPALQNQLYDDQGNLRLFVKVFVGEDDIRDLNGTSTALKGDTTISIVPAIAGGCCRALLWGQSADVLLNIS